MRLSPYEEAGGKYFEKTRWAMMPAKGGKRMDEMSLKIINLGLIKAASIGRRAMAHKDQAVMNETKVPIPAPA